MTHARHPSSTARRGPARPAFTLVELMISIALVLLLILGVNQVFFYVGQAVGAGEAINAAVRDGRSVQTVFANDFLGVMPNGSTQTDAAFLSICSSAQATFLTAADAAADKDANPLTVDLNGDGTEGDTAVPGELISPATYNYHNHRLDTLGLFTRGSFQRQTGNDGTFVANMSSPEAFVSYGHLWLPDNQGTFDTAANPPATYPGVVSTDTPPKPNPNNRFASQFVLGRMAMQLRTPDVNGAIFDAAIPTNSQSYISNTISTAGTAGPAANPVEFDSPLFSYAKYRRWTSGSTASVVSGSVITQSGSTNPLSTLNQSRLDLGGASIQSIQSSLTNYITASTTASASATNNTQVPTIPPTWVNNTWWLSLMGLPTSVTLAGTTEVATFSPTAFPTRFQCNPFPAKPLTAAAMAQASPYFLKGCSQFTVEYAGDFLTQDNSIQYDRVGSNDPAYSPKLVYYGNVVAAGGDGTPDYVLVPPAGVSPVPPRSQWRRQVLWYGLPRNTSGLAGIHMANGDVVPLRDWRAAALVTATPSPYYAPFEKTLPTVRANYADTAGNGMSPGETYTCVFGPNDPAPTLIRITVTLVDETGRLPEGQTYQYVYALPPQ